jgi:alpha-beta hydrolase superfamily lysophospholipase
LFSEKLVAREKSLKEYEGYFHESFNDLGKERFFTDLAEWISKH